MFHLSLDSNHYSNSDLFWILYKVFYSEKPTRTNKHTAYYQIPCAFDIETTSFYEGEDKRAIMYVWMVSLGGYVVCGRDWESLLYCLNRVSEYCGLSKDIRLCVYVHNLAYEFQFIRKRFNWLKVFALEQRKPVYCLCDLGIEFRCSYLLSGYSLERLGNGLNKYKVNKLVGNLDYSKPRHALTPLDDDEWSYCVNDVLVVTAYIQERIEQDGSIQDIPITKTGYVRRYCKRNCLGTSKHRDMKYRRMIHSMNLDVDEYGMLKRSFQGGFTHANAYYSGRVVHGVSSYDFTSSYPTVMISEKFPMSSGERIDIVSREAFETNIKRYCCMFDIEFIGIYSAVLYENYLSMSHCRGVINAVVNNGRIVSADRLVTTITEQDFMIIQKLYQWESMSVGKFIRYKKDYLPTPFVKSVLSLYADKTTLKGVKGSEVEYMLKKEMLNSCYGMTVTDICRDEITYSDDEWGEDTPDIEKAINKYNDAHSRFMFYPWGVWITAYARRNLFTGIVSCGTDYVYSDTDSIKILNPAKHRDYIERYNETITHQLEKAMNHHGLDVSSIAPKSKDGKEKPLGVWDYEGTYMDFKTLGAKRYLTRDDSGYHMTVAGLGKRDGLKWILFNDDMKNPMDQFSNDLHVPAGHTGKMLHTYIDDVKRGTIVDYMGVSCEYEELSAVHLESIDYSLSIGATYADYLLGIQDKLY